jgi:hypothetical protein
MKLLKKILITIACIIGILLITALFVRKDYSVERAITINKPKQDVFNYIRFVKNQDSYNKWVMADPNAKKEFKGTDGTTGFIYSWDSRNNKVGQGEQEIKNITDGSGVDLEIHFIRPLEGIAHAYMSTESISGNDTKLTWGMKGRNRYPLNLTNLIIDKMLGGDLEESLGNIKRILENNSSLNK